MIITTQQLVDMVIQRKGLQKNKEINLKKKYLELATIDMAKKAIMQKLC
jgi:hypothetical protein